MNTLIVGGSRGIGLALVRARLADAACSGVISASRRISAEIQALLDTHGERLAWVEIDVSDEASVERAAAQVQALTPALHLLVNCAGLLHADGMAPERRLSEVTAENLLRSYAVNAVGVLLVAKHFLKLLAHHERAVLANISARVGSIGDNRLGGWYAYRAAKAAQNQITRTLAVELARRAPRLSCVALHPGTVDTALSAPFSGNVAAGKLFSAERAAQQLLAVIAGLADDASGRFYAWDGAEIPW